jgi:hypothetical protein
MTQEALARDIRTISAKAIYGFKVRGDSISASDTSDPDCGTD